MIYNFEIIIYIFLSNRNLWLSIVIAVPAVTALYVLTNISYFTVLNKAALLSSNAVAVVCRKIEII